MKLATPVLAAVTTVVITSPVAIAATGEPRLSEAEQPSWVQADPEREPAMFSDVDSHAGVTWAVGTDLVADFPDQRPLVMRWEAGRWVAKPQPMTTNSTLNSVDVVAANNVWAVGEDRRSAKVTKPLVMHWNGRSWKVVPAPAVPTGSFSDVEVGADGSVWASGWAYVDGTEHAAVFRYVGGAWQTFASGLEDALNGNTIAVLSDKDAWLGVNGGAMLTHFDGIRWTPAKGAPLYGVPTALEAVGPDDIWMAGIDYGAGVPIGSSLLMHYDGTKWTRLKSPAGSTQLYDLAVRGGRPYAVGESFDADFESTQLVLHYDGVRFVRVAGPTAAQGTLTGVSAAGNRLWVAGYVFASPTELAAYAAHTAR